jgi:hypothetical protein
MDRLQVKSNIEPWTPHIFLLGPLDAAGNIKDRMEFGYHESDSVVVPVEQGRFVLKHAEVPKALRMTLERVSLPPGT